MKKRMLRWITGILLALSCTTWVWALPKTLIPGGHTVGIKLYSQGLVITGFDEKSAAKKAGLKKGDVIVEVDGEVVHTAQSLRDSLDGDRIVLTVLRKGREAEFTVKPDTTTEGSRLGAYIRDSMAGIGTVTYYDPDTGDFGALGHGVTDADAEVLLPIEAGVVVKSSVASVEKGAVGEPGQLKGEFDVRRILGQVDENTEKGIFGKLTIPLSGKPLPVAEPDEVQTGKAVILSNVDGEAVREYSVEIVKLYPEADETGRNLLLQITDPVLLRQTGGIVQGMSGSPIIQDGKLVGAVTHVLVNDPTRGYGIFLENMMKAAG